MYEAPSFQDVQSHFVKFENILETCLKKEFLEKAFQKFAFSCWGKKVKLKKSYLFTVFLIDVCHMRLGAVFLESDQNFRDQILKMQFQRPLTST